MKFTHCFNQHVSSATKENVLAFLSCYRQLKATHHQFPTELKKCIRENKWLRTHVGNRSPIESILYGPEWDSIRPIASLPFIDDSDNNYGKGIQEYKDELKALGVVVEFKEGAKFVVAGLRIPKNPSDTTPTSVLSLLECIRNLWQKHNNSVPKKFLKRINTKWLKTHMGYQSLDKCLLFDAEWGSLLQREDGPFIDEGFYGSNIMSYRNELHAIAVTVDITNGCDLLATHLASQSQFTVIARIYMYLRKFNWGPDNKAVRWIWIPNGCDKGEWVSPGECVIYDKDSLFGLQSNVLEKYYEKKILSFFSVAFEVRHNPSIDDYCKLWKDWENSGHQLTHAECCAFWVNVAKHWTSKTGKLLADSLVKLPVDVGSSRILLVDKNDVFIPDDLQLKDLFENASTHPLFVWYPQRSLHSLPRTKLLEIYCSVGIRTISESVQKDETFRQDSTELKQVNPRDVLIREGLLRLVLGFLADPSLEMDVDKRHQAVKYLLDLTVLETGKPIMVSYVLPLSSGRSVKVESSRMIRWERDHSKLFTQKMNRSSGHKTNFEFAINFSAVISEGLLWEKEDWISGLSELIKLGFLLEFEEEAIRLLMKSKNLQLLMEDEEFLASELSSN